MPTYLIHTCNNRLWYVKDFLIPSMLEQGIPEEDILVYQDKNCIGNLRAWVDSCNRLVKQCEEKNILGVWHLQDDVVISKTFAERTKQYDYGLVCGFTCSYDVDIPAGEFYYEEEMMWYSFPCIRIPTYMLKRFTEWANLNLWQSNYFKEWVVKNKADDLVFKEWVYDQREFNQCKHLNLAPNLVDHIDYMLGGTVANKQRDPNYNTRSKYWDEEDVIKDLEAKIKNRIINT